MSKKINFLRAGAFTMVLALGTTCFMSGTLAKYVTSGEGSDSARVAKFGVKVTAMVDGTETEMGKMFATQYETDDTAYAETYSVVSSGTDNIVAPGTKGNMSAITITGQPEVAVRVSYDVTKFELTNWTTDGTDQYCPIIINVNGTKYNCLEATDINSFKTTVIEAIEDYSKDYAAGKDLSTVGDESLAISWEWPFESGFDEKDTALGDRAAANVDNAGKIELTVKTTVTQID